MAPTKYALPKNGKASTSMLASPGNKAPCLAAKSPPDEPGSPERHYRPSSEDDTVNVAQPRIVSQAPVHLPRVARR